MFRLEVERDKSQTWFPMTRQGGELWSPERCPIWDRFCIERYRTISRGRTQMSVLAISARIRDDFLALWPRNPARRRIASIKDHPLIYWHPFATVYVGMATYEKPRGWTPAEYLLWAEQDRQHWNMLERERSWWRCVPELQRFVPKAVEL